MHSSTPAAVRVGNRREQEGTKRHCKKQWERFVICQKPIAADLALRSNNAHFNHLIEALGCQLCSNVMNDIAQAMIFNPQLKVMLNMGYFDLGTPYFEGVYEMHHLPIPASLQKNIEYAYYASGHMVYLHSESLKQLHDNVARFINGKPAASTSSSQF